MSDGSIRISVEVNGKQIDLTSKSLDNLESSGQDAGKGVKQAEDGLKGVGEESTKSSGNVKKFAAALGLVAIGAAAFKVLRESMDDAISRFDTLNQFPRVMEQIGFSTEESERAINKLSDGIEGLPTRLDEVTSTAQQLAVMTGDLDEAVDTTLALNNAFLASSASTADAQRGLQQYVQMLSKGEVDIQSWRTLQETMGVALNEVANAFGYAGESAQNDLYQALKDGHITFNDFNAQLIEISNETGGFADRAKTASSGIATSLGNLRIAAARGIANIIESFDNLSKEVTGKDISENIDGMKNVVNASFTVIGNAIEGAAPIVKTFAAIVKATINTIKPLTPTLIGLTTAYGALMIVDKVKGAIKASNAVLATAQLSTKGLTLVTKGKIAATVASTTVTKADTVAQAANAGMIKASTLAIGLMTGQIKIAQAAKIAFTAVTKALGVALKVASGPIGWVTLGIGALAGAVVGVVKWFKRSTEEGERLKAETEELGEVTDGLVENVNNTSKAYEDQIAATEMSAAKNESLAKKVEELAVKENLSAGEKEMLRQRIEALNGSIDGLNLAYDEEAGSLNMSSQELQARLDLMKETESGMAAQERLTEIIEEQNEAQMKLEEINALRDEWNEKLEANAVTAGENKEALAELDEQEQALNQTLADLAVQQGETEQQVITSTENMTTAIEEGNIRQVTSYDDLSESQQAAFDSMKTTYDELAETATNAFDKIETETEHTMTSMIETMEHNQRQVEKWGENQAELLEWAGKNGYENFIPYIENMGIDSVAELEVLANAGDTELKRFADAVEEGAGTAGESLKTSLGNDFDEAIDTMIHFVDDGSKTMREQIESSGFDEIGSMIPEGMVEGVEGGIEKTEKITADMAERMMDATTRELGIKSPSRVYRGYGGDITDGMALGVQNGTRIVLRAVQQMFRGIRTDSILGLRSIRDDYKRQLESIRTMMKSQFTSIGSHAMSGLNAGLNGGRGRVMATARNIANQVASTMRSVLKIQSPSKLMRDDIGKMIPAGIAVGIEDNAKDVYRALNDLSVGMVKPVSPEVALGTSAMAYPTSPPQFTNNTGSNAVSQSNQDISNQTINVSAGDVYLDGYKVGEVVWRPVKENIDRETAIIERFGG